MLAYGFPWPKMLNCDNLPSNDDLCIAPQHVPKRDNATVTPAGNTTCSACQRNGTFEELRSNYCAADFVAKIKMDETVLSGSELRITSSKKANYYKIPDQAKPSKKQQTYFLENAASCDCHDLGAFKSKARTAQFILMGKIDSNNRFTITYVYKFDPKSIATRKSLRTLTKKDICAAPTSTAKLSGRVNGKNQKKTDKNNKFDREEKKKEKKEKKMKRREKNKKFVDEEDESEKLNKKNKMAKQNKKNGEYQQEEKKQKLENKERKQKQQ